MLTILTNLLTKRYDEMILSFRDPANESKRRIQSLK